MTQELATSYMDYLELRRLNSATISQYFAYIIKIFKALSDIRGTTVFFETYKDIAELQDLETLGLGYFPKSHHYTWYVSCCIDCIDCI